MSVSEMHELVREIDQLRANLARTSTALITLIEKNKVPNGGLTQTHTQCPCRAR